MQDSRTTRGKTNLNQFSLAFHPPGIPKLITVWADCSRGGPENAAFQTDSRPSPHQQCAWVQGTPPAPLIPRLSRSRPSDAHPFS